MQIIDINLYASSGIASKKILVMPWGGESQAHEAAPSVGAKRENFRNLGPLDRRKRPFQTSICSRL